MYKWSMRIMIGFLVFMSVCILWNLAEYGIQELRDGQVSLKPKGWATKPHGGKYGD